MSEQPSAMTGLPNKQIRTHMATPMGAYRGAAVKRDDKGNVTGGWLENLDSWKSADVAAPRPQKKVPVAPEEQLKLDKESDEGAAELRALGVK